VNALTNRRHPAAVILLLLLGLLLTGTAYAALAPKQATAASTAAGADQVAYGKELFVANCATCHGKNGTGTKSGPSLAGVGAAAVDFQVGTGRMPLMNPGAQAPRGTDVKFDDEQIAAMAAYVASLSPGPAVPEAKWLDAKAGDPARGGEIYRVNCAMCHNARGAGGALTRGKYAPPLIGVEEKHIFEAMETGPQSMPVFNDKNLSPEDKRDVIAYLKSMDEEGNPGGQALGSLGPVSEGMFAWIFGLLILVGAAVWLGQKSA